VTLGLVVVGVEVVFTWFLVARQDEQVHRQAERDLDRVVEFLGPRYEELIRTLTDAQLRHNMAQDTLPIGLHLTIRFPDGHEVSPDTEGGESDRPIAERTRTLRNEEGAAAAELIATRTTGERVPGSMDEIGEIALFGIGVLAVSLGAVFAVSAMLSARLVRIARGADRFASGDLRHRIEMQPTRELAALIDALNEMAVQLNARIGQIRAQQNELEQILRSMEQGVIAVDASLLILRMNAFARRIFGVGDQDVRGRRLDEIVDDGPLCRFAADGIADPSRRTEDFVVQTSVRRADLRVTRGALLDAEDEPVGAIMVLADMSQLRRLETVRSDFAANVSHELRTPITNIKGYVETLLDMAASGRRAPDDAQGDPSASFLKVIARNAERLGAIVDDMLTLTSLERTDTQQIRASLTPSATLIGNVRSSLARMAQEKGIEVRTKAEDGLKLMVNPRLAEQALANLVGNAIKYSPPGTRIDIEAVRTTLESGAPGAKISVADQGPGIPEEHLSRIFERFYRVDKARSREQGGTGLGLSIVKHIAIVHGGAVTVESEVGKGSTFHLFLPAAGPGGADPGTARAPVGVVGGEPMDS